MSSDDALQFRPCRRHMRQVESHRMRQHFASSQLLIARKFAMKRIITAPTFLIAFGVLLGGFLGAAVVRQPAPSASGSNETAETNYTCSMHPQIIINHPDICPLCGMDLTPVRSDGGGWEEDDVDRRLALSPTAQRMADVGSVEIGVRELFKEIRTVGKVDIDETQVVDVAARLRGPIQQVYADFPGTEVRRGDRLVSIFGTDVYPGQQEYLFTRGAEVTVQKQFPGSSLNKFYLPRRRLEYWGMNQQQIEDLAKRQEAEDYLVVCAPIGGTIIDKKVRLGQFVLEGEVMYTIADLSHVWLVLDVYESELSWLRLGQPVEVTLESEPHRPVTGKLGFIEPVVNDATRSVRVRVILENAEGRFKPGMYGQAMIRVPILADGTAAPSGLEGKFLCPMHPYEIHDEDGTCDRCGTPLEQVPGRPATSEDELHPKVLAVPADAVLTTGRRQLAYLELEPGKYQLVEPKLGPRAGDYYPVISGLKDGDRVVTRGNFLLDSQFQITGKTSLLYPKEGDPDGLTAKERANFNKLPEADREAAIAQRICPISGMKLGGMGVPHRMEIDGRVIYLCCKGCKAGVKKDPEAAFRKIDEAMAESMPMAHAATEDMHEMAASMENGEGERGPDEQQKSSAETTHAEHGAARTESMEPHSQEENGSDPHASHPH